jgi:NDP-sugar pyrophosphorylase family protein
VKEVKAMKALILAAGKGTRLQQLTQNAPKPMLAIGGKPLLDHLIGWLRAADITQIAINLHHLPAVIPNYFGDGRSRGVTLTYSYEAELLGTAGAAKRLAAFLDEPFLVIYGDGYTNLDLTRLIHFHQQHQQRVAQQSSGSKPLATLALYRVPNPTECGLVELDASGRVTRFVEKPAPDAVFTDLASAGVLVCEPALLHWVPPETVYDFGRDLFPALLQQAIPLFGLPLADDEFLIDIGTPNGYQRAQALAATAAATGT